MIIGLHGYQQAGKDTVGKYLVDNYGFIRVPFAEGLKDATAVLFGITVEDVEHLKMDEHSSIIVKGTSKDQYPSDRTLNTYAFLKMREVIQRMGTEVGRNIFGPDTWINLVEWKIEKYQYENVVITDCRFPNEAEWIRTYAPRIFDMQTAVIEITRPGFGPKEAHASEERLPTNMIDMVIENHGSVEQLHNSIDEAMRHLPSER